MASGPSLRSIPSAACSSRPGGHLAPERPSWRQLRRSTSAYCVARRPPNPDGVGIASGGQLQSIPPRRPRPWHRLPLLFEACEPPAAEQHARVRAKAMLPQCAQGHVVTDVVHAQGFQSACRRSHRTGGCWGRHGCARLRGWSAGSEAAAAGAGAAGTAAAAGRAAVTSFASSCCIACWLATICVIVARVCAVSLSLDGELCARSAQPSTRRT